MPLTAAITPLHLLYLAGVIFILTVMILRQDTPIVCIVFLFLMGLAGLHSLTGGIQAVFYAILYASKEFMEIIATIALVTALSRMLGDLGSDRILMAPMKRIMKRPAAAWWFLGLTMFLFSLFLWPSPSVALIGAIMLPFALQTGLSPLLAAMAMNLFGHGFALSYDAVIQGAPAVSAAAAGITAKEILTQARPVFLAMGIATTVSAFWLNRREIRSCGRGAAFAGAAEGGAEGEALPSGSDPRTSAPCRLCAAAAMALLTPCAFLLIILLMLRLDLNGGAATSMVSGAAILLMCLGAVLGFGRKAPEKATGYLTDGFLFAIRIFAPVIIIGAFFFLGGSGITAILGEPYQSGILTDWAIWLAAHTPLRPASAAFLQILLGGLTGLDGSGFSGLPLTGALAQTFGAATGASVPVLAALGQIAAVFVGGGTIVPWGIIPVAAICGVSPVTLARKNLAPVCIGFLAAFITACLLLRR